MKYYPELATLPAFTFQEAVRITGNKALASKVLNAMVRKGSVHRIRQNLYTCVNFGAGEDYASRFQIASKINSDSFLDFHSALEFYGFYNQAYCEIQVCSPNRFAPFSYEGYEYRWFSTQSLAQVKTIQGVRVVGIERAIVDSVLLIGKAMDVEELVQCLSLIPHVDEQKILEMMSIYNQERLYRKVGYVLSFFQEELMISDEFFRICKQKGIPSNKGYLIGRDRGNLRFDSAWGLYAYPDLKGFLSQGGDEDF